MKWEDWRDAICYFFKNSLIGAAGGIIVIAMTETKSISTVLIVAFILAAIYLLVYPTIKNLENTP